ncbi:uncharacterized protein [Miscanthus floridulus]|uniref:uncharacterized protein n=1 Tax=Miscanthus floridulus TaxID=154761 RepID=UPI003458C0BE
MATAEVERARCSAAARRKAEEAKRAREAGRAGWVKARRRVVACVTERWRCRPSPGTRGAEAEIITAFIRGLHHHELRSKFNRKPPIGIGEMIMTANQYADAKEAEDKKLDNDTNDGARGRRPPGGNNNAFQDHDKVVATIFRGLTSTKSRRDWKLTALRVLAITTEDITANPSYRPWSEVPITFRRADQWVDIPYTREKSDEQLSEAKAANNASCSRASALVEKTTKSVTQLDLMPDSLSQADLTVLQELPEDVKADLFSALPLHRSGDPACSTSNVSESKSPNVDDPQNPRTFVPPGSSQKWIEQFRVSSCLILNVIAEQHTDSSCQRPLSSVLEPVASFLPLCPNSGSEEWNETHSCLSELLRHYIQLKVEDDIEELYKCFCLLKRFSSASEFFLELHDSILPFLQDSVSQHYGGTLQF